jgi:hypothetical protein
MAFTQPLHVQTDGDKGPSLVGSTQFVPQRVGGDATIERQSRTLRER